MKNLQKIIHGLSKWEYSFAGLLLAVTSLLNLAEIIRREIFSKSFLWIQELSIILVCWMIYMGAAYIYNTGSLLNVDFLQVRAKGTVKFIWDLCVHAVSAIVLVVLLIWGTKYALVQFSARTYALHLPYSLYSIPLTLSAASMLLKLIEKIYMSFMEYQEYRTERTR